LFGALFAFPEAGCPQHDLSLLEHCTKAPEGIRQAWPKLFEVKVPLTMPQFFWSLCFDIQPTGLDQASLELKTRAASATHSTIVFFIAISFRLHKSQRPFPSSPRFFRPGAVEDDIDIQMIAAVSYSRCSHKFSFMFGIYIAPPPSDPEGLWESTQARAQNISSFL